MVGVGSGGQREGKGRGGGKGGERGRKEGVGTRIVKHSTDNGFSLQDTERFTSDSNFFDIKTVRIDRDQGTSSDKMVITDSRTRFNICINSSFLKNQQRTR